MSKVDLGLISTINFISGDLDANVKNIGTLPDGEWICVPVYPLNIDITASANSNNDVIVSSAIYRGAVVIMCVLIE